MTRVRYEMDQKGTAPLLDTPELRRVLRSRAEKGADAARGEQPDRADQITAEDGGRGTGQWTDRAASHIVGPADALNSAVDAVEEADR